MIVSQSKGLSQIPASVWKRYGVTDPSKLDFKVVPRTEYNGETGQNYDTYDLVDKATGITLDQGNLGQITGDLSGSLIPDAKGNLVYQVQKPEGWSLGSLLSGIGEGVGHIATSDAMKFLGPMIISGGLGGATGVGNALGIGNIGGGAVLGAGTAALTGGDPLKGAFMGGLGGGSGAEIGDTGITIGDALKTYKGIQALQGGNPLGIASLASQYLPSGEGLGLNSKDFEAESFPTSGGDQFPQPFTVALSEDQPPASSSKSPLDSILPNAQKIIGGLGTAQKLVNSVKSGPLGAISALTQIAKSSAPQASGDKLPPARADVRTLFPVSNSAPAYVEPSKLTPLNDFESLSKLLTG